MTCATVDWPKIERMVRAMVLRRWPNPSSPLEADDLVQAGLTRIWMRCPVYDETKYSKGFTSWALHQAYYGVQEEFRRQDRGRRRAGLPPPLSLNVSRDPENPEEELVDLLPGDHNVEAEVLSSALIEELTFAVHRAKMSSRERFVVGLMLRHDDITGVQIAEILQVTDSRVGQLKKSGFKKLHDYLVTTGAL